MNAKKLDYRTAGVDYDVLDTFKRACQREAAGTGDALRRHGMSEAPGVRGESAYFIETEHEYLAHVEEALGTKILVADAVRELTGKSFYQEVAIDDVATMVNDLVSCGALPVSVAMYAAVGDGAYFADEERASDLAAGFARACRLSGAVWGGGETQVLKGMVSPGTAILGGSALGRIAPKSLRVRGDVREGDAIVLVESSGVQTNGLTLCRSLVDRLFDGYLTALSDGRTYGEALLDPSVIYVRFVRACQDAGVPLHYLVHVTGHGWRKLMRLDAPFVYRIEKVPDPKPVFDLIVKTAALDPSDAYGTFNMGVGFAAYVAHEDAERCLECALSEGYRAFVGGRVTREGDRKAVVLDPVGVVFEGDSLRIRS